MSTNTYHGFLIGAISLIFLVNCTFLKATALKHKPTIVKSLPPNGAVNVGIDIAEIIIEFDRPLDKRLRVISYAREFSNSDAYWKDKTTLAIRMPKILKPFSRYRLRFEFMGFPDHGVILSFYTGASEEWCYDNYEKAVILHRNESTNIASWLGRAQIDKALTNIAAKFRYEPSYRIPILIYPNDSSFRKGTHYGGQGILFNKATICLNPEIISYYSSNSDYYENIFRVIKHEYTHFVVREYTKKSLIPLLIDEGLAEYIANRTPPYARTMYWGIGEDLLKDALRMNALLDWNVLLRSDYRFFRQGTKELNLKNLKLKSSQTFSFITYLIEVYGFTKFLDLLDEFSEGVDLRDSFSNVYGLRFENITLNWQRSIIKELLLEQ